MKKLIFIAFIFISQITNAQTSGCLPLQKGKFKMNSDDYGPTYITRTKTSQIEEMPKLGIKAKFDITWVSECKYELRNKVLLEGEPFANEPENIVVIVEITKVNLKSYNIKISSNHSDITMDAVVEILK
ncbi:MAG: hypothetical protein JNJ40_16140 [Bacteroidia bacterium]|nr:hypothetical protein [Bacteroidia bacterium]